MNPPRIPPVPVKEWPEGMRAAMAALRVEDPRHPYPKTDPGRPRALNQSSSPEGMMAQNILSGTAPSFST